MTTSPSTARSHTPIDADAKADTNADAEAKIVNIAAYKFVELHDLQRLRDELKQVCKRGQLKGTILVTPEGINLFLAGTQPGIDAILACLRSKPEFADLEAKVSYSEVQPFNRMLVKLKREIIAFGVDGIAPQQRTSPKLSATELKRWLDEGRPVHLLDTRNDYEVDLGTFDGAQRLDLKHFRDFPRVVAESVPEEVKKQPVVMFCTGGIRCEKAGPMMEQLGFEQVYQLDGGILKYFEECGGEHYHGGCFVFDSRVVLGPDLKPTGAIQCFNCQAVLDHEDIQSPEFSYGKSCPHCYQTPDESRHSQLVAHEEQLRELAQSQPGRGPYTNRRLMHVPARLAGKTVIEFLCEYHPPTLRQQWEQWLAAGTITSDGRTLQPSDIVREGQRFVQLEVNTREPDIATDIRIAYEDEAIIVVDKPAPLPVHPSGRFNRNTLQYLLAQIYKPEKLRIAHRLDANTSGLVLFTRKYAYARELNPQFERGEVNKAYWLRVHGSPSENEFVCEAAVSDDVGSQGSRHVDEASGRDARTSFRVLHRFSDGTTLLEAVPQTGRTHQIRLHAQHMGMPIVGDSLYSNNEPPVDISLGASMCLHAFKLEFTHPGTGKRVVFFARQPNWASA